METQIPEEMQKQMAHLEGVRDVVDKIKKMEKQTPLKEVLDFAKKHFTVNAEDVKKIEAVLEGKAKTKADPIQSELLTDLHHYMGLARLKLRKHDPESPDLDKIKIAVNNRLARLRSEAGLTKTRKNKKA